MASFRACNEILGLIFLVCCFCLFPLTNYASSRLLSVDEDLVSSTCKKTLYFQLCVSSLRSDPQSQTSDLRGLATIALNLSTANGVDTLSYISALKSEASYNNGSQLQSILGCLSDCIDVYSDAIQNLQDSVPALNDKSYDTLQSLVSAAMTDSETCEDGFKEIKGSSSPLTEQNEYFSRLCSNFLAITTLLY
ncbi:Pectinesterase inhibitor domain containing protein [Trema orientale]|uniref:Pectinesterase inhibitor domain containing protein n=1 Tax=Trema orientale TaxID=63057 RepID=A0A2P5AK02_TREOI|nr:Pectinesterase inhibitor domain containing protein [Trema orientale]